MSDLVREIAEITERYKKEMVALTEKYLKTLEAFKERVEAEIKENLKEKIETEGLTYFG